MPARPPSSAVAVLATLLLGLVPTLAYAQASALPCRRAIAKETSRFVKAHAKALARCADGVRTGKTAGPCPDARAAAALAKASTKLATGIGRACGGADRTCGTADDDLHPRIHMGFPDTCPDLEGAAACAQPIADCADVTACVECLATAGVAQAIDLAAGAFPPPAGSPRELERCRRAIVKEAAKFLATKERALHKCWDARLVGKHASPCPSPGDGKAAAAIARAEAKLVAKLCQRCGGADRHCGTADDLAPGAIGFAAACPDVTVPDGAACGGPVASVQHLVACLACVAEFDVDCVDAARIPWLTAYPAECDPPATPTPTPAITPTGPTPSATPTPIPPPPPCGDARVFECDGVCPVGQQCVSIDLSCTCVAATQPCGLVFDSLCWGECPPAAPVCRNVDGDCVCLPG